MDNKKNSRFSSKIALFFLFVVICWLLCAVPANAKSSGFWTTWGDDRAEVSSYRLTQSRYGELREGRATLIYVAEPMLRSTRVKPDGEHDQSDVFYVLKLNHLRTFQTGIYPYRLMTSTFVHVDPEGKRDRGAPAKTVFSSQEWCGQVFHQLQFDQHYISSKSFSYFDGEADQEAVIDYPVDGLTGDDVFISVRRLFKELVAPGESRTFDYLPSLAEVRLNHRPLEWSTIQVTRSSATETRKVPAGSFEVEWYQLESEGRPTLTIYVESGPARRIVAWEGSDGETAELTGSERMQYWKLNRNQDEALLKKLGTS